MSTISNQPPAMSLANESLSPDGLEPGESGISQAEITPDPRSASESNDFQDSVFQSSRADWRNFAHLLDNYALDPQIMFFLDESISQGSLSQRSESLSSFNFTQKQFVDFIVNFAEGLQRSAISFEVQLPQIEIADGQSPHVGSIHYDPGSEKIRLGMNAIAEFVASPRNIHLAAFELTPEDLAFFAGWEEGTHFAQSFIESKQLGISQTDLASRRLALKPYLDTQTNYIAADPAEVFAGFILREEFREKFSHDENSVKLSYQQDLYVLEQIKKSKAEHEELVNQLIMAKENELAEVTSQTGQFPGLKPAGFGDVTNLKHLEQVHHFLVRIREFGDKVHAGINALMEKVSLYRG